MEADLRIMQPALSHFYTLTLCFHQGAMQRSSHRLNDCLKGALNHISLKPEQHAGMSAMPCKKYIHEDIFEKDII